MSAIVFTVVKESNNLELRSFVFDAVDHIDHGIHRSQVLCNVLRHSGSDWMADDPKKAKTTVSSPGWPVTRPTGF